MKRIHAAGMFGCTGKRKTFCGLLVDDDQLPIIGSGREINCQRCLTGKTWRDHQRRWRSAAPLPSAVTEGGAKW